jgi:hypothetical protein
MNEALEKEQRELRQQTLKDAEALQQLVVHPGWACYLRLIEAVGQNFASAALAPLESLMDAPKAEFAKGALKGLQTAAALPHLKIGEAEEYRRPTADGE